MLSIQNSSGAYSFSNIKFGNINEYDIRVGDLVTIKKDASLNYNQNFATGGFDSRIYKVRGKTRQIESIEKKNGQQIFITKRESKGELNKFHGSALEIISSRDIMIDIENIL